MPFELETRQDAVVIRDVGRLTRDTALRFRDVVRESVGAGSVWVVVDLAGVTSVDSMGLAALVEGLRLARDAGGDLRVARAEGMVADSMEQTNLDLVFHTFRSVEAALDRGPAEPLPPAPRRIGRHGAAA